MDKPNILIICGPTASGKSKLAIELAKKNNGVIINADSAQIYKEIPILSCSPSSEDKKIIQHHLYNYVSLIEKYSVSKFLEEASAKIKEVSSNGSLPIIVGGTGLYIKALLEGISKIPDIPEEVRKKSRELFSRLGNEHFYAELARIDQKAAKKLQVGDSQRLIRAYEVFLHTNKSIYDFHEDKSEGPLDGFSTKVIIITANRENLYQRCNERFAELLKIGAIEEVEKIADIFEPDQVKAIGYKEIYSYIKGEISKEEALSMASQKTRNYAKRQVTFFNHQIDGKKIDMDEIDETTYKLYLSS